jgi:PilX N-terminal
MRSLHLHCRQRGVVLVVSLLVLLLLGIIATTVARTNLLQLRMAGNDEARTAAMQQALAVVDAVLPSAVGAAPAGGVGYRLCLADSADPGCDEYSLALAGGALPATGNTAVAVTRVAPLEERMPVLAEAQANSTVYYRVAKLEVQVSYDGSAAGIGRATIAQGLLLRLPASPQVVGAQP